MAVYLPLAVQVCVFALNIRPGQDRKRVCVCVGGRRKETTHALSSPTRGLLEDVTVHTK